MRIPHNDVKPLEIAVDAYGTEAEIADNLRYSLSLNLQEFQPSLCIHDGTLVCVGSGPTVKDYAEEIKEEKRLGRTVLAINGGHDFLCEHGLPPDLFLTVDPRGMPHNFKFINDHTIYLLASRVNKSDFELVMSKTRNVVIFHCDSTDQENDTLGNRLRVGGGTTSGLRAIFIGYLMGFRKFRLYGYDSCLSSSRQKRWDDKGPMADEIKTIDVIVGGRKFLCNMALAQQADEFQNIWEFCPDVHIESIGDGLITEILRLRGENANLHRGRQQTTTSGVSPGALDTSEGKQASVDNDGEAGSTAYIQTGIN